ncbi:MAG: hypothetical protein VXW22_12315, partial [Pseudomonadota bacterium]|nr:hypothetical protein [Pseudomonadota bacterium]
MKRDDQLTAPTFDLSGGDQAQLILRGDWVVSALASVDQAFQALDDPGQAGLVRVDLSEVAALDTAGAFLIDRTLRHLGGDPALVGASEEVLALLQQARTLATQEEHAPPVHEDGHGFVDLLERTGRNAEHMWQETLESL